MNNERIIHMGGGSSIRIRQTADGGFAWRVEARGVAGGGTADTEEAAVAYADQAMAACARLDGRIVMAEVAA
jgi:hypothetical protein